MRKQHLVYLALVATLTVGCQPANDNNPAPLWRTQTLVAGSPLHAPNGISFGPDGKLYAGSVGAQSIYRIDVDSGEVETVVSAPAGEADDVAFAPDGTLVWTALVAGEIRALRTNGVTETIVEDMALINPIHFTTDGRLFAGRIGFDQLYEFPVDENLLSTGEPRLVASKIGNLNSFEITADNILYGPLSNKGEVAQIDIETGAVQAIASGLGTVVAVNLDTNGNIWAIDWVSGNLWRISPHKDTDKNSAVISDHDGWHKPQRIATLEPPVDNLAVAPDGMIYVSRPAHSAIEKVDPSSGTTSTLIAGQLASPGGLAITTQAGRETLLLADGYGYRMVDTQTGAVSTGYDLTEFGFPAAATAAAASAEYFALTEAVVRPRVYLVDRKTNATVITWRGVQKPLGILLTAAGNPLVTDFSAGTLLALDQAERKLHRVIAADLAGPVGLAWAGTDAVYISEALAGTVLRINLSNGARSEIISGLSQPEGLTLMDDGRIAVVEAGRQRLIAVDPVAGSSEIIADNLPLGAAAANAPAPVYLPSGVAQGADGSLYVSADRDNSILKISLAK